jgi:hypothetical protein
MFLESPSEGGAVLYTKLIDEPLGCPELLTPQITDFVPPDTSKPS